MKSQSALIDGEPRAVRPVHVGPRKSRSLTPVRKQRDRVRDDTQEKGDSADRPASLGASRVRDDTRYV